MGWGGGHDRWLLPVVSADGTERGGDAEASHAILFALTLVVAGHAALRGWWAAAGWTLLFDVVLNGYPVLLQRYNRALLARRRAPDPREQPLQPSPPGLSEGGIG